MNEIITSDLDAKQLADRLTALELHSTSELARLEQERNEAQDKYATEATEHMLAVNKLATERDEARKSLDEMSKYLVQVTAQRDHAETELRKLIDFSKSALGERDEAREEAHRFRSLNYNHLGINGSASWFPWETSLNLSQKARLLETEKDHWRKQNENRL